MSTQQDRAKATHTAMNPSKTAGDLLKQASNILATAQAVNNAGSVGALAQGAALLGGAASALLLAANPDPEKDNDLKAAADTLGKLAACATAVQGAITAGQDPIMAFAGSALAFIPNADARGLASQALQVLAYAQTSEQGDLAAAQGVLGLLVSVTQVAAAEDAARAARATPDAPAPAPMSPALSVAAPFVAQLAGRHAQKYALGSALQVAADVRFLARGAVSS